MQNFQDIEHFVKTLSAAIKKKIPTKVSQLTNDVGYKTTDTNTTYKLSKSGSTVTLTGSDGSTTSVADSNTTYSSLKNPYSLDIQNNGTTVVSYDGSTAKTANFTNATTSANGLMSAADKSKLDGIGAGSNVKSVNGKTGAVTISKADVGLGNVDNTRDVDKHVLANNIQWGGPNKIGTVDPISAAMSDVHSANRLAFCNTNGITIEYSNDAGATWNDYGATNEQKTQLVTGLGSWFSVGKHTTHNDVTLNDQLRVTLNASSCGVYCVVKSLLLDVSVNGAEQCKVKVESATLGKPTEFVEYGTYDVDGWDGWNVIPLHSIFGGNKWQTSQTMNIRLTFTSGKLSNNYNNNLALYKILMFGDNVYGWPSNMAYNGRIYSYDAYKNVMFPAKVTAVSFSGATATSSADGLMSKTDKAKLDGIGAGSNVKSVNGKTGAVTLAKGDVGLGSVANYDQSKAIKSITRNGTTFTATALDGTKTTFTQQDSNTTYGIATSSADGLMSKSDKAKLDGISSGADAVTIKTVKVNGTALTPDSSKAVNVTVPTLANNATTTTSGMALDARMGKTLSDQISSVKAGAIDQIVNLTAAGWTGDAAPYSQTVNVTGMTEDLLCELFSACPKTATVAERGAYNEAFALVASGYAETADGSATFLVDEKPAIDIGVRIKSISKANAVSDQTSSDISNAVDAMGNTLEGRISALTADLAKQWEKIYPVGSIYISVNSTNPASLFGGTWERIKDRFLLAAGDAYTAGSTGGEAQHTLTVDEMPSHMHDFERQQWRNTDQVEYASVGAIYNWRGGTGAGGSASYSYTGTVRSSGGNQPHNNMPPYLAVYMWKRVS